jgi:hypothetical protein
MQVPRGFREVARVTRTRRGGPEYTGHGLPIDVNQPGYIAYFGDSDRDQLSPSVGVSRTSSSYSWLIATSVSDLQLVDVRGRRGYRVSLKSVSQSENSDGEAGPVELHEIGTVLFWWEHDDLVLSVLAPSEQEARELAESLREVSEEEWQRFVTSAQPVPPPEGVVTTTAVVSESGTGFATSTVP